MVAPRGGGGRQVRQCLYPPLLLYCNTSAIVIGDYKGYLLACFWIAFSDIVCDATRNFITLGKSHVHVLSANRCSDEWL